MIWQVLETPFLLEWQLYLQPHIHTLWFIFYMHTRPSRFGIYPFHPLARINFSHEKKLFSRQKVGRKIASNAGVSAHLPGQGHRGMGSSTSLYQGCFTALEKPSQPQGPPLQQEPHAHPWAGQRAALVEERCKTAGNITQGEDLGPYSFERVQKIAELLKKFTFKAWSGQGTIAPNTSRAERRSFELQGDVIVTIIHEGHLVAESFRT